MADTNLWPNVEHALWYLSVADGIPHRTEGEAVLLELLPGRVDRFADLGTGDGRLTALVRTARPDAAAVALDFSPPMLERARERFTGDPAVTVVAHDLSEPLPAEMGADLDAVVSSFAIHHVVDRRKRALFGEVFEHLAPGGVFLNLEHVASPTPELHQDFLDAVGVGDQPDDPSNKLAPVEAQLEWLRKSGFIDVDCFWKWRELALLAGTKG